MAYVKERKLADPTTCTRFSTGELACKFLFFPLARKTFTSIHGERANGPKEEEISTRTNGGGCCKSQREIICPSCSRRTNSHVRRASIRSCVVNCRSARFTHKWGGGGGEATMKKRKDAKQETKNDVGMKWREKENDKKKKKAVVGEVRERRASERLCVQRPRHERFWRRYSTRTHGAHASEATSKPTWGHCCCCWPTRSSGQVKTFVNHPGRVEEGGRRNL